MGNGIRKGNFRLSRTSHSLKSKRKKAWIFKSLRYWYLRFLRLKGKPAQISRGLALGVFTGCFPIFGFQIIAGVFLAIIFKGNKIAAAAGTWISNPLTTVPMFAFNYQVGKSILGWDNVNSSQLDWQSWSALTELGWVFFYKLFLGSTVVGLIAAVFTYFLSLQLLTRWQRSRQLKRSRKNFY
jgi:hypothetical protein